MIVNIGDVDAINDSVAYVNSCEIGTICCIRRDINLARGKWEPGNSKTTGGEFKLKIVPANENCQSRGV